MAETNIRLFIAVIILILAISFSFIWRSYQQQYIFYPRKGRSEPPEDDVEEMCIDGLKIWYVKAQKNYPTIIYFHGTNGNLTERCGVVKTFKCLGVGVIVFDYCGYGESDGIPSIDQMIVDSERVYEYVTHNMKIPVNKIILWGESLGGGPASYLASCHPKINSLILLSTFSSLDDLANDLSLNDFNNYLTYGIIKILPYVANTLQNKKWLANIVVPIAIIHSIDDDFIPYTHARTNFNSISHQNKILITINGTHGGPIISNEDWNKIIIFVGVENNCKCRQYIDMIDE